MQLKSKIFGSLLLATISFGSLQNNNQIIQDEHQIDTNSLEDDAFKIISYLSLFASAHEKYLAQGNAEPAITCHKCRTKILDLGEFEGGLIGIALADPAHFKQMQLLFDDYLKILSQGTHADIVRYMVHIANDIKQACSHCGERGCSWKELDEYKQV